MQTIRVNSLPDGIDKAKALLYEKVDRKTVLFLSGGTSPRLLYESLSKDKKLFPAAVALIDERYGSPFHDNSNEKMIKNTGLLEYFNAIRVPVHLILKENVSRVETASLYDEEIRKLLFQIPKSFAIMSIGADSHIAGLAPDRADFTNPIYTHSTAALVADFNDRNGPFGERITLTFRALGMMDGYLLWVFGKEKRNALSDMYSQGELEDAPARFFVSKGNEKKTVLITDQQL